MTRDTPPTASQTIGPFFHDALIRAHGHVAAGAEAAGQPIVLTGTVLDGASQPIDDALVEIWQPDGNGVFAGRGDSSGFSGFGRSPTDASGAYRFETVKPGAIAGPDDAMQAPFINVSVFARGLLQRLATRIYFGDEPGNAQDPILQYSVEAARRTTLIATRQSHGDVFVYRFDIVLQGPRETVFFDA